MRRVNILLVFLALLFFVGVVNGEEGVTDEEIFIGQYGPLTGVAKAWGKTIYGPKLYFAYINANGGIHGRKLVLKYFDDSYTPAKTMYGVKALQEQKGMFAWIGGVGTENGMRVKNYLVNRQVPWVGPFSGASAWVSPPSKHIFTIYPQNDYEAALVTRYAGEVLKRQRIAIIYQDDHYGKEALAGLKSQIATYPEMELVAAVPVSKQESKLQPYVQKLHQSNPDAVLLWVNPFTAVKILHLGKMMQFAPVWMAPSPLSDYEYLYVASRRLIEGLISVHYITPDHPKIQTYRAFYEQHKEELEIPEFTEFLIGSIGYAEPMVAALRACGRELTREKFVQEMEKIQNFRGLLSPITFAPFDPDNPDCRIGMKKFFMSQCDAGGEKRILTELFDLDSEIKQVNPPKL